jgi:hypothetical protein
MPMSRTLTRSPELGVGPAVEPASSFGPPVGSPRAPAKTRSNVEAAVVPYAWATTWGTTTAATTRRSPTPPSRPARLGYRRSKYASSTESNRQPRRIQLRISSAWRLAGAIARASSIVGESSWSSSQVAPTRASDGTPKRSAVRQRPLKACPSPGRIPERAAAKRRRASFARVAGRAGRACRTVVVFMGIRAAARRESSASCV